MTRKDFIFIAQVIRDLLLSTGMTLGQRERVAVAFADALGATNPRFNRELFRQAALGIVSLTARKAVTV